MNKIFIASTLALFLISCDQLTKKDTPAPTTSTPTTNTTPSTVNAHDQNEGTGEVFQEEGTDAPQAQTTKPKPKVAQSELRWENTYNLGGVLKTKHFFYNAPEDAEKTSTFCVANDQVKVNATSADGIWLDVTYEASNGKNYYGFMKANNIELISLEHAE